jgi:hypothetical protein
MTTTTAPATDGPMLAGRRFKVRFLGRRGTWLWLVGTGAVCGAAWALVALPARGDAGAMRSWYLWSGNVLLALFLATMLFVVRKWSIKLPYFRDFGRASGKTTDACWAAIQELNAKVRKGAFANDAEILAAADETLRKFGTEKIQRAELKTLNVGGKAVRFVDLRKKEPFGRLEPWLEMHMGVGVVACVGVLLHADFALRHPVGWTLFAGSMIVLVTGLVGALLYRIVPERLAKADAGIPYEEAGVARENHQSSIEGVLATLDEKLRLELSTLAVPAPTREALAQRSSSVMARIAASHPESVDLARDLLVMAGSRDELLWSTAQARRYDFWLRLWRWIHVPVSALLFFVIALHVLAVLWF